jgi:hypothetical protein
VAEPSPEPRVPVAGDRHVGLASIEDFHIGCRPKGRDRHASFPDPTRGLRRFRTSTDGSARAASPPRHPGDDERRDGP